MTKSEIAIKLKDVSFSYNSEKVLDNVTLDIFTGDFIGIIGPNGSGKTTLLKLILGLLKPDSGTIEVFGITPSRARGHVGYVPQHTSFDFSFPITVLDIVLMGRLGHGTAKFRYSRQDMETAFSALKTVELDEISNRHISELSGGQRQRVLIARALAGAAKLLVLDEPTANVDSTKEDDFYHLLKELNKTTTILLVTHDLGFISGYVNRVACVNVNLVCHPASEITGEIIDDTYRTHMEMIRHKCGL